MYDYYASVGWNCEGAFQIRRVLGRDESNFFSWNITTFHAARSLIDSSFAGIIEPENLRYHHGGLVYDESHDYYFHSDFPNEPGIRFAEYPDILANHVGKARYLAQKFAETAQQKEAIAYFYKTSEDDVKEKARRLAESLARVAGDRDNFTLVVLQEESRFEQDWGTPHISNRYLKRFAPVVDATDGHVRSWDRVFAEFPHRDGLRLAGY